LFEWLERFLEHLAAGERSPHTLVSYRSDLVAFARWFEAATGEPCQLELLTPTDLRLYKNHLVDELGHKPATVGRKLASLKSLLAWAQQAGRQLAVAPAQVPRAPDQIRPGPRWLDRREQLALLRAVERGGNPRDLAVVQLLLHTGLRVAELCQLTWQDVELGPRSGLLVVRQGKGRKRREIPLNAEARKALEALGYEEKAEDPEQRSERVVLGQRGPLTPRGVQSLLRKYLTPNVAAGGLERLSPHLLRHSFCKNLRQAGASLEETAALAGHNTLDTTRLYAEPSRKDLERAVGLLEGE
jgi:site-specific recombinase XerD